MEIEYYQEIRNIIKNLKAFQNIIAIFRINSINPHGNIFIQREEIAMGSVLDPFFSNLYMSALENKVFNTINIPNI